jgi:hypothetical protein
MEHGSSRSSPTSKSEDLIVDLRPERGNDRAPTVESQATAMKVAGTIMG